MKILPPKHNVPTSDGVKSLVIAFIIPALILKDFLFFMGYISCQDLVFYQYVDTNPDPYCFQNRDHHFTVVTAVFFTFNRQNKVHHIHAKPGDVEEEHCRL